MSKKFRNNANATYGIIGLGRFGSSLARTLSEKGKEVLVIDRDEEKVREMREYTEQAFVVDCLSDAALREAGVDECDTVVICIGERLDVSILTTLRVKALGVPHVVAKATSDDHGKILKIMGADVVYPERDMAVRLANRLVSSSVLDFIALNDDIDIYEVQAGPRLSGKTVREIDFRKRFGLNIIAIETDAATKIEISPDDVLRETDRIAVLGRKQNILKFDAYLQNN